MEKGLTLVEVIIALVVVSLGVISVATMQSTSVLGNRKSFLMSTANVFAEMNIEKILAREYANISNTTASLNSSGAQFQFNAVVVEDVPVKNCKEVTCIVAWNANNGNAEQRFVYVCPRYK